MADFIKAHTFTAKWEGGISDHPADRGGYTAYGVSQEFIRNWLAKKDGREFLGSLGFSPKFNLGQMKRLMSRDLAAKIFMQYFWHNQKLGSWPCQALATVFYDMSVNHGPGGACKMLQKALNAVNDADLKVDGALGPLSQAAARKANETAAHYLLILRENFFRKIVENDSSQRVFLKGWLNRVNDLRKYIRK